MELNEIHNLSLEWGAVLNIATRLADIEDRIGPWDDLANLVASLLDSHRTSSPQVLAQEVYPFLFRLYFRIKRWDKPAPFNQVSRSTRQVPNPKHPLYHDEAPGFLFSNYDFKVYQWAVSLKQSDFIANNELWIPETALTPAQIRRLTNRVKENRCPLS